MMPIRMDLKMYKGDSFELNFRFRTKQLDGTPGAYIDLSGCVAKAQVRVTEEATNIAGEFDTEVDDPLNGSVVVSLTPDQTSTLPPFGVWDLELTYPSTVVRTYLKGSVTVIRDVTRE